ncbi:MAG: hypothetical protein FWC79_07305 [Oscillospiraceae bacterium]|nr:hypothetical protein [Oscillospiraceae bacterium]
MHTQTELQPPFSYSISPIVIVVLILIMLTIYLVVEKNMRGRLKKLPAVKKINLEDLNTIKRKYLKQLEELNIKVNNNKITTRAAYQHISKIVRFFVYETTSIEVQNYALREIQQLNMPMLSELIEEYYTPAFAYESLGDIKSSIEKTRKVIEKWN